MADFSKGGWSLVESDAAIYTDLLKNLGVFGVKVEELQSLDESCFSNLHPVYGIVFLYKWRPGESTCGVVEKSVDGMFFAQQVISNACTTQALINLILNITDENVNVGKVLEDFKNQTMLFDPASRGLCLGNNEAIREVHNSYARQYFEGEITIHPDKEEAFQYVTFVPFKGRIYELDGLHEAPIDHGDYDIVKGWLPNVIDCLRKRIKTYIDGEINFLLLAVCADKLQKMEKDLEILKSAPIEEETNRQIMELEGEIQIELEKKEIIRKDNMRRRYNYIPFLTELMKVLAKEKKITPLIEQEIRKL
uniref:Ubiquitin carboxyl-terminal hydrolase n=1 Tax=Strongyloides stercoralis TaxID=6248 RepID=A0A0K0ED37_STRER